MSPAILAVVSVVAVNGVLLAIAWLYDRGTRTEGTEMERQLGFPKHEKRTETLNCGRCGWPNIVVVSDDLRCVEFFCGWCDQKSMVTVPVGK